MRVHRPTSSDSDGQDKHPNPILSVHACNEHCDVWRFELTFGASVCGWCYNGRWSQEAMAEHKGFTQNEIDSRRISLQRELLSRVVGRAGRRHECESMFRAAAKRGHANGSRPWVRSRRRPTSDVDSIPQSTTEATAGTSGWRTRLHTQTEGWSSRMVWTWRVRPE